jgi:hypothetical protein
LTHLDLLHLLTTAFGTTVDDISHCSEPQSGNEREISGQPIELGDDQLRLEKSRRRRLEPSEAEAQSGRCGDVIAL